MQNDTISSADLPCAEGTIYHLKLRAGEIAPYILLVGDPDRVPLIADEFFSSRSADVMHRGLRTITGTVRETGQLVSVLTSGMGTPSTEIVLGELYALFAVDLHLRRPLPKAVMPKIIRVGTSGGLQRGTPLGTLIISSHAVGLDNTGFFYEVPADEVSAQLEHEVAKALEAAIPPTARFRRAIRPYAAPAHQLVVSALTEAAKSIGAPYRVGITVSNSGFFANQGRAIAPIPLTVPAIDEVLANVRTPYGSIENFEMESSFLFHFMRGVGGLAGTICPTIAHRPSDTFAEDYVRAVRDASRVALKALALLERGNHR